MDPSTWTIKEWVETFGGPSIALFLLILNFWGFLWWKPQVEKLLGVTVQSAEKLDQVRLVQIEAERQDKNSWRATCESLRAAVDTQRAAMDLLQAALEDEKRKNRRGA